MKEWKVLPGDKSEKIKEYKFLKRPMYTSVNETNGAFNQIEINHGINI